MPNFPLQGERMSDPVAFLWSMDNDLKYSTDAPRLFAQRVPAIINLWDMTLEFSDQTSDRSEESARRPTSTSTSKTHPLSTPRR